jgi:hypothetical protein
MHFGRMRIQIRVWKMKGAFMSTRLVTFSSLEKWHVVGPMSSGSCILLSIRARGNPWMRTTTLRPGPPWHKWYLAFCFGLGGLVTLLRPLTWACSLVANPSLTEGTDRDTFARSRLSSEVIPKFRNITPGIMLARCADSILLKLIEGGLDATYKSC